MANKNNKNAKPAPQNSEKPVKETEQFPGYPTYPASEDIMNPNNRDKSVDLDMDQVTGSFRHNSELPESKHTRGEQREEGVPDWRQDKVGDDLDIPGAELDDDAEAIGEEDEENNLYSLGGDRHEDLEEDRGEFPDLEEDRN
ncbi:hypothetical protein [Chitinophaga nivalis]|uniref:Uncharacterized protein n=1 Tax=Chitinophaga nivalis TaxID=2991709 RepID=A0ABT3IV81_9BACT|nr:hypothetical protein [Chitinophaga nivalis]MCW3462403.1 hypothetical protein [Chitinophaga nivalis]MCW3487906.1 hypothetical protein [Chitinophaga nivalis]